MISMEELPDRSQREVSVFEDLDPEPDAKTRRWKAAEFAVALLVLLGVVFWVGGDWLAQQTKSSQYKLAEQAANHQDWDTARLHYAAAGNYRDATARADEAAKLINDRNQKYAISLIAASMGQWAVSLQAAQAVQSIQHGYRSADDLEKSAINAVYTQALSGTLALRSKASPPGIYYMSGDGWKWLQGSDAASSVWGVGPPGHAIYDIPGPDWNGLGQSSQPGRNTISNEPGTPGLKGRKLVAAEFGDTGIKYTPLQFDPTFYNIYVWGAKGVWAMRIHKHDTPSNRLELDSWYTQFDMAYQAWNRPNVFTIGLQSTAWAVMDVSPQGDQVLMAEPLGSSRDGSANLYVADGDGSNPRKIFSYNGIITKAVFSPDGKGALIMANSGLAASSRGMMQRSLIYYDLTGKKLPSVLITSATTEACYDTGCNLSSALFLNSGQLSGKILTVEWGQGGTPSSFKIIDPANPDVVLAHAEVGGNLTRFSGPVRVAEGPSGANVAISWNDSYKGSTIIALLEPGRSSVVAHIGTSGTDDPEWMISRDNRLLMYSESQPLDSLRVNYTISSLSMANLTDKSNIITSFNGVSDYLFLSSQWYFGTKMLAYTRDGQLRARTYDGQVDVPLGNDVDTFYSVPFYEAESLR